MDLKECKNSSQLCPHQTVPIITDVAKNDTFCVKYRDAYKLSNDELRGELLFNLIDHQDDPARMYVENFLNYLKHIVNCVGHPLVAGENGKPSKVTMVMVWKEDW